MQITEVRTPAVGDAKPSAVTADLVVDTRPLRGDVRAEWDDVKQHDVLFLLTVGDGWVGGCELPSPLRATCGLAWGPV